MTIELDSTLAQAEVLFLSFKKIVQDIDQRQAELLDSSAAGIRHRNVGATEGEGGPSGETRHTSNVVANLKQLPFISDNLRELIKSDW